MKKIYMQPELNVLEVKMQQIMAGSALNLNGSGDVTSGELQNENATSAAMSRGGLWDED